MSRTEFLTSSSETISFKKSLIADRKMYVSTYIQVLRCVRDYLNRLK